MEIILIVGYHGLSGPQQSQGAAVAQPLTTAHLIQPLCSSKNLTNEKSQQHFWSYLASIDSSILMDTENIQGPDKALRVCY